MYETLSNAEINKNKTILSVLSMFVFVRVMRVNGGRKDATRKPTQWTESDKLLPRAEGSCRVESNFSPFISQSEHFHMSNHKIHCWHDDIDQSNFK